MRHRVYGKKLGRNKDERDNLFKNLVRSLILHGSISTTESKAKAIKGLVDRIITQAKNKDTKRLVLSYLTQKDIQDKLFKEIVPATKSRTSGYTSMVRMGQRQGDGSLMVKMSLLVDQIKSDKSAGQSISKPEGQKKMENKKGAKSKSKVRAKSVQK